ncbi:Small ubiquitin-related modifier 2 [Tritrichomonas foetus]|uniref:Small ubiquitin-related modifier 2 n=1 Tax=Tritrichomonas foetus TaxID=1144522 RepID=A0A1J4KBW1_9EUKA|nr:Small ubiquitin-related modifier 2 [Tritrichomonas foetus]|eukprot:OHT07166.1 Small ubiquitin-related modifier 2 [Tritrichomonas foetus]
MTQDNDPSMEATLSASQPTVNLTIKDPQGEEIYFKVKRSAKMRRLFSAFCKRSNIDATTIRFFYQGERIEDDQTPDDLNLQDGDKIDAFIRQTAGGF